MIETVSSNAEIENLYKVGANAPYDMVKDGFGYYGVLISHKETGKIHCHICGKWFKGLGNHVVRKHGMTAVAYKKTYGFTKRQPLCAVSSSGKISVVAKKNAKRLREMAQNLKGKPAWNRGKQRKKHWPQSLSSINDHLMCPGQVADRYEAVSEQVGHPATTFDLAKYDQALLSLVKRRYKTFNKFLKATGMKKVRKQVGGHRVKRSDILLGVRECYRYFKHVPTTLEYDRWHLRQKAEKSYSLNTVFKWFGSWNRCLTSAGFGRAA